MLTTTEMLFQRSGLQLRIYGTERFHNFAYERFAYLTSRKKIGGTDDKQLYHHMYSRVSSFKPTPFVSDRSSSSPAVGPLMHQGAAPVDLSLNRAQRKHTLNRIDCICLEPDRRETKHSHWLQKGKVFK